MQLLPTNLKQKLHSAIPPILSRKSIIIDGLGFGLLASTFAKIANVSPHNTALPDGLLLMMAGAFIAGAAQPHRLIPFIRRYAANTNSLQSSPLELYDNVWTATASTMVGSLAASALLPLIIK